MTVLKPKPGVTYLTVRELAIGQKFAHTQSSKLVKVAERIDEPDRKGMIRVWYRNHKGELRSMALFPGTKLIDMTGHHPKYRFVGRHKKGSLNGLILCYQFSEVTTKETVLIQVNHFWGPRWKS